MDVWENISDRKLSYNFLCKHFISGIILLYGGNMRTCLCALAAGLLPVMSELLHALEPSSDRGPQSLKAIPSPAIMPSVQTTRPGPVHQKRTGSSRMVSHTWHNIKQTCVLGGSGCRNLLVSVLCAGLFTFSERKRVLPIDVNDIVIDCLYFVN